MIYKVFKRSITALMLFACSSMVASAAQVLFVAGSTSLSSSDQSVLAELQGQGHGVQVIADDTVQTSSATGKNLIVISESVNSGLVGNKFTQSAIPVISYEPYLFDNLGMTGATSGTSFGLSASQTKLNLTGSSALTGGLSGSTTVSSAAATFVWGVPGVAAIKAATIDGNTSRAAIFAYEANATMVSGSAPARRVAFYLGKNAGASWNASGRSLFNASVSWALGTPSQGQNQPPVVNAGANVSGTAGSPIALNGSVTDDGLATPLTISWNAFSGASFANASRASTTVTFGTPGTYTLTLTANDTQFSASDTVTVTVSGASSGGSAVLLVVGSTSLSSGDQGVLAQLQSQGHSVQTIADNNVQTSSANGKNLIVVSESVNSGLVGNKFTQSAIPVVSYEPYLFDNLGMTGATSGTSFGLSASQTKLSMTGSSALTGGLSGSPTVSSAAATFVWGVPGASAIKAATLNGNAARVAIFGYEANSAMVSGTAPARRVAFYLGRDAAASWNTSGKNLFNASVNWALGTPSTQPQNQPPVVSAGADVTGTVGSPIALSGNVTDDGVSTPLSVGWNAFTGASFGNASSVSTTVSFDSPGIYNLTLTANDTQFNVSDTVRVTVNSGSSGGSAILLVVGSTSLSNGDQGVLAQLQALGHSVQTIADNNVLTSSANGKSLIIVSESVNSGLVGNKFTQSAIPVISYEPYLFDNLGMTGATSGTSFGLSASQTKLSMTGSSALTGGFSGSTTVSSAAATFVWGVPGAAAIRAATIDGNTSRAAIFAYEANSAMVSGTAPARRVAFYLGKDAGASWNASGKSLFNATVGWALGTPSTQPQNQPPVVNAGADVSGTVGSPIALNGSVTDDGIATPLTVSWNAFSGASFANANHASTTVTFGTPGTYTLTLAANDTQFSDTDTVRVTVGGGSSGNSAILLVVGSTSLSSSDQALRSELLAQGHTVQLADDNNILRSAANGKDLVVISGSVNSGNVNNVFNSVAVPVLTTEPYLYDNLGLTNGTSGTHYGLATGQTSLDVTGSSELTAGLSGAVSASSAPKSFSWGTPGSSAIVAARIRNSSTKAAIFGYRAGDKLANGAVAVARRVAFFPGFDGASNLTTEGRMLFDAAVSWALDSSTANVTRIMALGDSITFGVDGQWSFRRDLLTQLTSAGCRYDMVGDVYGPTNGTQGSGNFDRDHEGHRSFRTDQVLSNLPTWLAANRPDWVVLHLGTNDVLQGVSSSTTINHLDDIIDRLRSSNSRVGILLAQIIPTRPAFEAAVVQLNTDIASLGQSKNTSTSPVVVVDQYSGYSAFTNNYDQVHPNNSGESLMAGNWSQALIPRLSCTGS